MGGGSGGIALLLVMGVVYLAVHYWWAILLLLALVLAVFGFCACSHHSVMREYEADPEAAERRYGLKAKGRR
jgi:Zn-dependent protease with chaperone function